MPMFPLGEGVGLQTAPVACRVLLSWTLALSRVVSPPLSCCSKTLLQALHDS